MAGNDRHTRWESIRTTGREYAARFEALAASGEDVHGEAAFCAALLPTGSRVLDAGCGTGRVAVRLDQLGFDCVGVDADASMLEVARGTAPSIPWVLADLSTLEARDLDGDQPFDMVVMAGNVVPLLAPGSVARTVAALAAVLKAGGLLVAGFGLDSTHLPAGCPVTGLEEYDAAADDAGLELVDRFSTWAAEPFVPGTGYAVSVHRSARDGDTPSHK